jgi:hypothetical protein
METMAVDRAAERARRYAEQNGGLLDGKIFIDEFRYAIL